MKPFTDFYINCEANNQLSIATTVQPTYKNLACVNYYRYGKEPAVWQGQTVDYLVINTTEEFSKILSRSFQLEEYRFRDPVNFSREISDLLLEGHIIWAGVDLFYWIPGSVLWQKYHVNHYSLVVGYDRRQKIYYCFDDDLTGYRIREIPEERFIEAFSHSGLNPSSYLVKIPAELPPYVTSLEIVLNNAEGIIQSIGAIEIAGLWNLESSCEKYQTIIDFAMGAIARIANRQVANGLLFQHLYESETINEPLYLESYAAAQELINGWQNIKNIFIKRSMSNKRDLLPETLHRLAAELFGVETAMWRNFLAKGRSHV
ncbi:MAG TPA: hypothetical protein VHY08_02940 [Bacillota bacterium]|nr:hypothetical protein [Bacillota bacterium]